MREVVLVAYESVQALDVVGPADVFGAVREGYALTVATPDGRDVRAPNGLRIGADRRLADLGGPIDTLLVAGGWGALDAAADPALTAEVARLAASARRVGSVCTGTFILAAAGLLDGRRVTTHWAAAAELARRHPTLTVEPDRIHIRDGHIATSAGVTAGIDLALALVAEDHGPEAARTAAQWLVAFVQRPGGQSQFARRIDLGPAPVLRPVLDAILADPAADHGVPALAARAALSERHLSRVFAAETGTTPARFVERVRVDTARALLERTSLPVAAVARRCGFGDDERQRRAFLRVLGVSPADYRARFTTSTPLEDAS